MCTGRPAGKPQVNTNTSHKSYMATKIKAEIGQGLAPGVAAARGHTAFIHGRKLAFLSTLRYTRHQIAGPCNLPYDINVRWLVHQCLLLILASTAWQVH